MMTIAVLTATRAEYGLLSPIIKIMSQDKAIDVKVVVTGAHLSSEFGLTYKEIEADGVAIDEKIEILENEDSAAAVSKTMGNALIKFGEYFERKHPDALLVLGDRYETLAVCAAAMNAQIPVIHLYGGETTQGAIDEAIRHSISKMSYLHFTSTEEYRHRVIQLGENPNRVFTKEELFREIWDMESIGDIATVTVHIKKIREKIEQQSSKPQYIETIWGVGYRFKM